MDTASVAEAGAFTKQERFLTSIIDLLIIILKIDYGLSKVIFSFFLFLNIKGVLPEQQGIKPWFNQGWDIRSELCLRGFALDVTQGF